MSEYKTLNEWFPDGKPDGRLFEYKEGNWIVEPKFKDKNGVWYCLNNLGNACSYYSKYLFKEYTEPKKTKKVKMYKPVFKDTTDQYCANSHYEWDSIKPDNLEHLAGYLEMEAEVQE